MMATEHREIEALRKAFAAEQSLLRVEIQEGFKMEERVLLTDNENQGRIPSPTHCRPLDQIE